MADVMMPDGSNIRIPDFALDITAKEMLLELKKLNKDMDAELEKLVKATKEQIKKQDTQDKEASKDRDEQNKTLKKISENRTKFGDGATKSLSTVAFAAGRLGKTLASVLKTLGVLGGAAVGLTGALSKLTLGGFVRLGETLNEMTKSGVAFGDGVEHGGMGAIDAMSQLRLSGIDAAKVMMTYSNVVQSLGKRSFVEFNKSFMEATDSGALLGMSLDESADRLGRELANRQRMGALDASQRSGQLKQITTTLKRQQAYSTALGVSTEELAAFTEGLLSRTPALTASLNRLSSDLRSKVIAGITDFGTAMRALGGSEGGAIAEAFTEAAAMGGIGFSDSMTGYITAMPSLAGPANAYIKAVQSGTLTQDQANDMAQNLAKTMGNATQAERARIFSLARAGDAQAQSMANAITQFEQSKNKLAEINETMGGKLTMDGVQEGTNRLQAIFRMLGGTVDALKMQFLQGLGSVKGLTGAQGALKDAMVRIQSALFGMFNGVDKAGSVFNGVGNDAESLGKWFGRKLPDLITYFSDKLVSFIIEIPKLIGQLKTFLTAMSNAYTTVVAFKDGVMGFLKMLGLDITREEQKKDADGKLVFEKDADGNDIPVMIKKVNWGNIGLAIGGAIVVKMLAGKLLGMMSSTIASATGKAVGSLSKRFLPGRGTSASAGTGGAGSGAGVSTGAGGKGGAGSGLINMARGLKAIANPQALAGLAAITLAINGIAFALKIAAPAFEPFGKMILSIAQGVAPVLIAALRTIGDIVVSVVSTIPPLVSSMSEVIFSVLGGISELISSISGAIAGTITAVADGISSVISAIKGDQEAMMQLQTDQLNVVNQSIVDLSGIPSKNLFNTARGISSIAEAMKSFADTVMGREGGIIDSGLNLFRGAKTDGTDAFIDSINRFAAIDGERIAFNAQAIINANRAQAGLTDFASMPAAGAENADIAETVIDHSVQIVSSDVNEIASAGFGNITETVKQFLITLNTNILTLGDTLNSGINKAATLIPVISSTDNTVDLTEYNRQVEQLRPVIPNRELMFALGRSGVDISDYLNGLDQLNPVIPSTQTTVDLSTYSRQFEQLTPVITGNTDNKVDLTEYNRQFEQLTPIILDQDLTLALGRSGVDISDYLNGLDQLNPVIPGTQTTVDLTTYSRQFEQLTPVIPSTQTTVDLTTYSRQFEQLTPVIPSTQTTVDLTTYSRQFEQLTPVITGNTDNNVDLDDFYRQFEQLTPVITGNTDNNVNLDDFYRQFEQLTPVITGNTDNNVDLDDFYRQFEQLTPVIVGNVNNTVDLTEYNRQFEQLAPVISGNTDNNVDLTEYNRQFQDLTQQHLDEMPAIMTATKSLRMRSQQATSLRTSSLSEQDGDVTNTETRVNAAYVRSRMTSTSTIASRTQPNQVAAPVPAPMPVTDREAVASDPDNNLANQPTDPTEQIMPGMGNDVTEVMMAMLRAQQDTNRLLRQGNGTTRDLVRSL